MKLKLSYQIFLHKLPAILFLFSFFIGTNGYAQQSTRLINNWEFLKQDLGGIWESVRPVGEGNPESVPLWQKLTLPHCINATDAVDPDVNYYQGPAWYRTALDIQNPYNNGRTLLHFEGAGQKTQVYIYITKVGEHVGGYDEFTVDITDAVAAFKKTDVYEKQFKGKIPLSIRTDNSRDLEMIPSDLSDFNVYGGIYRYLNLKYIPALSIDKVFADATIDAAGKRGNLKIKIRPYNPLQVNDATATIKLIAPNGKVVKQSDTKLTKLNGDINIADYTVPKPAIWHTDNPQLYTLQVDVAAGGERHSEKVKIGFRNFEFKNKGPFFLNGKRLLLKGTHRHEDHAGVGAALTEEQIRTEMQLIKDMGVNFLRLGHYQQSRIALELCDSLGIVVWEEIPWCRGGLGGPVYQQQAKRMLTNMIEQHYNHPSIILWGMGNENDWPGDFDEFDKEKIRTFMKELHDRSHQLDPSRKTAIRRCDFCKDIVDVYSPSIWAGWYRGIYPEYKEVSRKEFEMVNHFLHVEWGGDSHAGRHSEDPDNALQKVKAAGAADERAGDASLYGGSTRVSKDGDWSESYIVNLFDWHLKEQEIMPWLTGTAQWVFKDFSTPVRPENPVPYMNQKGVIERDFTKKASYYVFQSYWATKPMLHIYGHSWPVRWGAEGEEKTIKAYSNCDEAELFLNGKSYDVKKRNSQDFPAAGLRWNVVFQKGENNVRVVAKKGKLQLVDSLTVTYQTEKWGKPAKLVLGKSGEENGVITITAKLYDSNNVLCLDAANFVRFGVSGDAALIDDKGTANGSRVVQLGNGRASIRIKKDNGKAVASVKSKGVPTALLDL